MLTDAGAVKAKGKEGKRDKKRGRGEEEEGAPATAADLSALLSSFTDGGFTMPSLAPPAVSGDMHPQEHGEAAAVGEQGEGEGVGEGEEGPVVTPAAAPTPPVAAQPPPQTVSASFDPCVGSRV